MAAVPKVPKRTTRNRRFLDFLRAVYFADLLPYTTRSQNTVVIVTYDVSSALLAPLPLTLSTVEPTVLFVIGMSGSGAGAEAIR